MNMLPLMEKMMAFDSGDPKRIQHFLKVFEFARMIGRKEGIPGEMQEILEMAAIVHDIGIRPAEEKYGRCDGKLQEQEGPARAREMLSGLDVLQARIDRVCYLVGHHHTYTDIEGMDYQILVEADFLVNLYEEGSSVETVREAYNRIFKTEGGREICRVMFGIAQPDGEPAGQQSGRGSV